MDIEPSSRARRSGGHGTGSSRRTLFNDDDPPPMPRLEHVLWVVVAAFMVLWCHTIVAGASQNYLLFSWPDHYLKPGWLPGWAVVAVTGVMRAQTRFMVTLMKLIGYWGPEYEHTNALGLTDPTIPGAEVGRWVDRSNPQWSSFRDSLPLLAPAFLAAAVLSRATQRVLPRLHRPLMVVAGLAFLAKAHGARALFFLAASVAYYLAAAFLPDAAPAGPFVWALNLAMLYLIRIHQGFSAALLPRWLAGPLDSFGGDLRWDVCFNISALRLISFAIDMTDARRRERRGPGLPLTQGPAAEGDGAQRDGGGAGRRVSTLPLTAYTLGAYLEYLCYPPLYIAGPIVTFDNFAAARKHPPPMLPGRFLAQYAFRACLGIFCVEFLLHFNYLDFLTAQGRRHVDLSRLPVHQLACISFAYLVFLWLKFLSFWRFFRFFALLDGIPAPENMRRCICNNMSVQGFWREWHTSFYQWLVRYLYVPLGGNVRRALAVPVVFVFVAVWHEADWRIVTHLLVWAGIMAAAMLPEVALTHLGFLRDKWDKTGYPSLRRSRWFQASFGAVNIVVLVAANAAGFCFGGEGLRMLLGSLFTAAGIRLLVPALATFFCGAQIMLEVRGHEKRVKHRVWPWDPVNKAGAFQLLR